MTTEVVGIILKETPYSNTSKIIQVLAKDYGLFSVLCKGAKSLKSQFRVTTLPFNLVKLQVIYKKDKLSTLITADIIDNYERIKTDIVLISYMAYLMDLTYQIVKQTFSAKIYTDLLKGIEKINQGLDPLIITNIIELKFLSFLGVGIDLAGCVKCGNKTNIVTIDGDAGGYICKDCLETEKLVDQKTLKMLRMYYYVELASISSIQISNNTKLEINNFLEKYYERYTGLYLKSKDFLNKLK